MWRENALFAAGRLQKADLTSNLDFAINNVAQRAFVLSKTTGRAEAILKAFNLHPLQTDNGVVVKASGKVRGRRVVQFALRMTLMRL